MLGEKKARRINDSSNSVHWFYDFLSGATLSENVMFLFMLLSISIFGLFSQRNDIPIFLKTLFVLPSKICLPDIV